MENIHVVSLLLFIDKIYECELTQKYNQAIVAWKTKHS
jgi:hypothetical protein